MNVGADTGIEVAVVESGRSEIPPVRSSPCWPSKIVDASVVQRVGVVADSDDVAVVIEDLD